MTVERSRQLGQALMAASGLTLVLFLIGVARRSYLVLAIPVLAGLAVVSGLVFWVGSTMASAQWSHAPLPLADAAIPAAAAPDPDSPKPRPPGPSPAAIRIVGQRPRPEHMHHEPDERRSHQNRQ